MKRAAVQYVGDARTTAERLRAIDKSLLMSTDIETINEAAAQLCTRFVDLRGLALSNVWQPQKSSVGISDEWRTAGGMQATVETVECKEPLTVRKRPAELQAMRFNGQNATEIVNWAQGGWREKGIWLRQAPREGGGFDFRLVIPSATPSLTDTREARPGDWIVKAADGELYPCHPESFERAYEVVR
jgi:hypothetical protein